MSFWFLVHGFEKKTHEIHWCHLYLGCVFGGLFGVCGVFASSPGENRRFVTMCDVSLNIWG